VRACRCVCVSVQALFMTPEFRRALFTWQVCLRQQPAAAPTLPTPPCARCGVSLDSTPPVVGSVNLCEMRGAGGGGGGGGGNEQCAVGTLPVPRRSRNPRRSMRVCRPHSTASLAQYNKEVDDDEVDCIPFQLQKLFGMLQMSTKRAVSTKELTNSFGWNSGEAFQQNDVQEVCVAAVAAVVAVVAAFDVCAAVPRALCYSVPCWAWLGRVVQTGLCSWAGRDWGSHVRMSAGVWYACMQEP
jgi:hypothetical protein